MKKFLGLFSVILSFPLFLWGQALSFESGQPEPAGFLCQSFTTKCPTDGDCIKVCNSYISGANLVNFINSQVTRAGNIEASVTAVRQDFKPIFDSQAIEINTIKNQMSSAELMRMVQKAVREELNQRGL